MKHTHDDTRLTFGCPACIARVEQDQRQAVLDEQPDRPITIDWIATAEERGTIVIDAKYVEGEKAHQVADRIGDELFAMISKVVPFDDFDWDILVAEFGDALKSHTA